MIKRIELRTLFTVITLLLLANCTAVKEGLSGQKSSKGEEFLIQKKRPLVMPPDYGKIPLPKEKRIVNENQEKQASIEEIIGTNDSQGVTEKTLSSSIEESILKEISID
tara:strand:+ start:1101 stop:1427 length:327 start_codon:yes stop_codon:yes gene_type:complete